MLLSLVFDTLHREVLPYGLQLVARELVIFLLGPFALHVLKRSLPRRVEDVGSESERWVKGRRGDSSHRLGVTGQEAYHSPA